MSKRPTNRALKECENAFSSANPYGFAIIGDTSAAIIYARRLLNNGVTTPIDIITEGQDKTNINGITRVSFPAVQTKRILNYLTTERLHYVPAGDNDDDDDDGDIDTQNDQFVQYYVGAGPLGDYMASYMVPRVGPWFPNTSNNRLDKFMYQSTIKSSLTNRERYLAETLARIWNIPLTSSVSVRAPAVLNCHYSFITQAEGAMGRNIFLDEYNRVNQANNVNIDTENDNLRFSSTCTGYTGCTGYGTSGCTAGLYDVHGSNIDLQNVKLAWKTNPYTYLRIATNGGLNPEPLNIPTFYRAVLSVTGYTGGTGSTGATGCNCNSTTSSVASGSRGSIYNSHSGGCGGGNCSSSSYGYSSSDSGGTSQNSCGITDDLINTHLTYSMYDLNNPKQTSLAWLGQVYTTPEDLSVVEPTGRYADSGNTLLIVESLCTKNRRRTTYNSGDKALQVNYNDRIAEHGYLYQFAQMVSTIYNIHTGGTISPDTLINDGSICSNNGVCQDNNSVVDYSRRQSPLETVMQTASNLYGVDIYPSLGTCASLGPSSN